MFQKLAFDMEFRIFLELHCRTKPAGSRSTEHGYPEFRPVRIHNLEIFFFGPIRGSLKILAKVGMSFNHSVISCSDAQIFSKDFSNNRKF